MISLIFALAGLADSPDSGSTFLEKDAYRAIWADLELNATIGNGNEIAGWDWYFGDDRQNGPIIHIKGLNCSGRGDVRQCRFLLLRDLNPKAVSEAESRQPHLLSCSAEFHLTKDDGWKVKHLPPPNGRGHSQTTMVCHAAGAPAA